MILQVGQILDQRYRVEKHLGEGGMGEVYKVRDPANTAFAIKLLKPDLAEDLVFLRRFKREAQTLQKLTYPSIVRFYELVETDHLTFLVMDYVEGITLRSEIFRQKSPFSLERIIGIYQPICSALDYAHKQGVIHCDVKPANIMIETSGKVLLTDFGISRLSEISTTATSLGSAGTPAYMAPERVQGLRPRPATDVYSLGIILFELLSGGERPFTGEQAQITGSIEEKVRWEQVNQPPPPIRAYNPQVSPDVEQILLRCLEKDPADRFSTTRELIKSLEMAFEDIDRTFYEPADQATFAMPAGYQESVPEPIFNPSAEGMIGSVQSVPSEAVKLPVHPVSKLSWLNLRTGGILVFFLLIFSLAGMMLSGTGFFTPAPTLTPVPTLTATPTAVPQPTSTPEPTLTSKPTSVATISSNRVTVLATSTPAAAPVCTSAGQTWTRPKDKSTMVCVPGGDFAMGFPNCREFWCQNEANKGYLNISAFWIDQNEVTNDQFQKFVSDTGFETGAERMGASEVFGVSQPVNGANWRAPQGPGSSIAALDEHPVVHMNWFSADAYCEWAGGKLPSEAEWEKAARGTDGRLFPWGGNMPGIKLLNAAGQTDGFRYTAPVGSFPSGNSPYGLHDMAGNVFEWTRSLMKQYPYNPDDGREIKEQPGTSDVMVLRGGSFYTDYGTVRSTWRAEGMAQDSTDGTGFRCIVDR